MMVRVGLGKGPDFREPGSKISGPGRSVRCRALDKIHLIFLTGLRPELSHTLGFLGL